KLGKRVVKNRLRQCKEDRNGGERRGERDPQAPCSRESDVQEQNGPRLKAEIEQAFRKPSGSLRKERMDEHKRQRRHGAVQAVLVETRVNAEAICDRSHPSRELT